jgi:outer membrane protein OmpA-like peptidoglycan-associated protein
MQQIKHYFKSGLAVCLLALLSVAPSYAITYTAGLENSEWHTQGSELECRLWQPIPSFGEGMFTNKAGYGLQFHLKAGNNTMAPGVAKLSTQGPYWKPGIDSQEITELRVFDDIIPLVVQAPYADVMLASLTQGLMPVISTPLDASAGYPAVKVGVSTVNFENAYADYAQCVRNLLPVNYKQISRSSIFYTSGRSKLAPEVKERLDLIIRYVKADKRITRVVIDGHTDSTGDKKANISVSKQRASLVLAYFKKEGVSKKRILMRWHGDKYPTVDNDSADNRARNRRVTIRLDRE